jgi:hypothetical protein
VLRLSPPPSEGVSAGAVLRLALAEADADVALELDGVAVRELEGVERGREESLLTVVLPFPEYVWVGGAAVLWEPTRRNVLPSSAKLRQKYARALVSFKTFTAEFRFWFRLGLFSF